jgi:hypothetical protein
VYTAMYVTAFVINCMDFALVCCRRRRMGIPTDGCIDRREWFVVFDWFTSLITTRQLYCPRLFSGYGPLGSLIDARPPALLPTSLFLARPQTNRGGQLYCPRLCFGYGPMDWFTTFF